VSHGKRLFEAARDPERAHEVAAGPAVHDSQLGAVHAG
jgi:hypothetical protein